MQIINAQNFSRDAEVRNLISARNPGEVLLEADLSQAEARVVTWYAQESQLMDLFQSGAKVHEYVGSKVMQREITKKHTPIEYETSKRIVHGSNYGMKAPTLAEVLLVESEGKIVLSVAECRKRQNAYFQNFPRIKTGYHMGIQEELRNNLKVLTTPPIGMQRKFYTPWGDELFRQAYAHYAQNVVAWITNNGINEIYYNSNFNKYLYMQNHDAILLSLPQAKLEEGKELLVKVMTKKIVIKGEELVIPVECKTGFHWGEMENYV